MSDITNDLEEIDYIFWHRRQNKAKLEDLKEESKSMLKYILKLSKKVSLPAIVAGDSNVKVKNIETLVLHKYKRTERWVPENIIDFFTLDFIFLRHILGITVSPC
jgi:hypothetical protein